MQKFIYNMSIKTIFLIVLMFIITLTTIFVVAIRSVQIQNQQNALIRERLQGNANLALGIFEAVRGYTYRILDMVPTMPHIQDALEGDTQAYENLKRRLLPLLNSMNQAEDGIFINIADSEGTIFFSNSPDYIGRHVDDLGIYEAFGHVPLNTIFNHTSPVSGIDKIAYITIDPGMNWTIISFFDAGAVDSIAWAIFISLLPTLSGVILASILMLIIVSRSLQPLKPLAAAAEQIANGDLDVSFDIHRNDEIAQVSRSFLEIVKALNILRDNFSMAENSMTKGNIHYRLKDPRLMGVYDKMFTSTNNIVKYMQQSQIEAERSSKAKSDFLATMSHEIRTPLNAIIGISQIQLQKKDLPDTYATALEKIYASGNSLLGIINDILDLSKIETGKLQLNSIEYDIPSLINDTIQLNIIRIGSKPIEFILEIDESLPSRLLGDELRLKQILNNLLSNAIKYTEKGHVKLAVNHAVENGNIVLYFVVEDTGQGMKLEDRQKFFSEYQRFNTETNRSTEGTGLGLNITKKLVEMMDGTIWAESEYGHGSVFLVSVRQKPVKCPAIGAVLASKLRNFTFTSDRRAAELLVIREPMPYGKVLIVDDVETNLYVAEGLISSYQIKVETATSGFIAIEKTSDGNTYDIIFMDHMMPQMDGIETTEKLRELGYAGTIVALTANALVGNDEMFMQKGFDGFIAKPIDIRQLDSILNKFIRDKYPQEAIKYKHEKKSTQTETDLINHKLIQVFRRDAQKAVVTLRETAASGDIKLFTITVHAMKSALGNVGEHTAATQAAALENAGLRYDTDFIAANTEAFLQTLETLIRTLAPDETAGTDTSSDVTEDTEYLKKQLEIVKTACENYDVNGAYAALDKLKEKQWKVQTTAFLEKIHDLLYLDSDFDAVVEMIENFS